MLLYNRFLRQNKYEKAFFKVEVFKFSSDASSVIWYVGCVAGHTGGGEYLYKREEEEILHSDLAG